MNDHQTSFEMAQNIRIELNSSQIVGYSRARTPSRSSTSSSGQGNDEYDTLFSKIEMINDHRASFKIAQIIEIELKFTKIVGYSRALTPSRSSTSTS